ncbi:hypothetical protein [Deinococcus aquiradiocola]|uniref:Uncharacterized protein n=1 Tax=Deinococcus aquiradiocola TaxID=393059 RepID=A0A917PAN6_9DEIO|nr:hypothetical protein [Deinococcus aquiradiocola]GGJ68873.1 hypothetical protein GCM10008939_11760 [Deinococcus aquiradiocola]
MTGIAGVTLRPLRALLTTSLLLLGAVNAAAPAAPPAGGPVPGAGTPAVVTLTLGETGTSISPLAVSGFNVPYDMSVAEALPAVRSIAPTSLRYPPGNVGDEQDLTRSGLTGFRSTLQLAGPQARATVETRVFSTRPDARNRPEDAAQAARDARALGLNVEYWEIGNEPDLYATNRGDPSWTPERYCRTFRAQRAAILQVDPRARFAGPAVSNVTGAGGPFLEAFVKACGDVVDLLTWHEYPTDGQGSDEDALATADRVTQHLQRHRALMADPASNPLGAGRTVGYGVTEYGLSYVSNRSRHLSDMVAALWAAETTLRLADGGATLAQYFALIGSGSHGLVDLAGIPRPTLYAFRELRTYAGTALPLHSSDPAVWAHAALNGTRLTVIASNTATTPAVLRTALPGYRLLGAKGFTAQTVDDEAPPARRPLGADLTLPARSLTRLVYARQP